MYSKFFDGTYYIIKSDENGGIVAECTQCHEIKRGHITSTGNFITHYKLKHCLMMDELRKYVKPDNGKRQLQSNQPTLTEIFQSTAPDIVSESYNFNVLNIVQIMFCY